MNLWIYKKNSLQPKSPPCARPPPLTLRQFWGILISRRRGPFSSAPQRTGEPEVERISTTFRPRKLQKLRKPRAKTAKKGELVHNSFLTPIYFTSYPSHSSPHPHPIHSKAPPPYPFRLNLPTCSFTSQVSRSNDCGGPLCLLCGYPFNYLLLSSSFWLSTGLSR